MHPLRLHSHSSKLCKQLTSVLNKRVKPNFRQFCCTKVAQESIPTDSEQLKAAVLHPKRTTLNVEKLLLPNAVPDGQIRIGIDYCALNSFDIKCIRHEINSVTLPFIPGSEFSGEILELGPKCKKNFKVGDKVAILSSSKLTGGGLSHECFAAETECIRIDPRLSTEQATTVIQGYSNALLAFTKYMPLAAGDDIIVCAGPGGDGLAAIEVADKIFKANVYVLYNASSVNTLVHEDADYQAMGVNAGLTKVYNFFKNTLHSKTFKAVYDCYDSKLLHVVADFISPKGHFLTDDPLFDLKTFEAPYFKKCTVKKLKRKEATIEDIEAPENIDWATDVKKIDATKYQRSDPNFYKETVNQVFDWYATEKIQPYVSQTWNLSDVNKAMQFMTGRKCLGKVLIKTQRHQ